MRVLIVSESTVDRDAMARYLAERAHTVETAVSTAAAMKQVEGGLCEVVVLDWVTSKPSSVDFLRRLRSVEGSKHVYAIVVMSQPAASSVSAAFVAGADDLLRRPFLKEELVVRVGAIERIRRWATKVLGQAEEIGARLARLRLGQSVDGAIGRDLGSIFERTFDVRAPAVAASQKRVAVEIPISLVDEAIECRLQLGIDADSLAEAAKILLGADAASASAVADMLRELANVAGGAFVGAAEADGFSVTLGLPTDTNLKGAWGKPTGTAQEFTLGLAEGSVELSIRIVVESRELRSLCAKQLRPGMVVARNICNHEGALLLPAATHLTESSVARLAEILGVGAMVVVLAQ